MPANIYMRIGLDVHQILDDFTKAVMLKKTDEKIDPLTLMKQIAGEKFTDYELYLNNFLSLENERLLKVGAEYVTPIKTEQKIVVDNTVGIIDRVDFDPASGYTLYDYKTGNVNGIGKFKFELTMYKYLIEKQTGLEISGCGIISLKDGRIVPRNGKLFTPTQKDAELMFTRINSFVKNVEDENFEPTIKSNCYFCLYNKICPKSTRGL